MDAIGTPFCVTIDHQTKEDNTVTIRYRDTMTQELSFNVCFQNTALHRC
jgi:glycyl-tRNA synthetase (class II)